MDGDHDEGLYEQSSVIAGAGPVEDFEDGGCEHDEGDVEGEASGGTGTVDGEDLVGIGGYGGEDEAVNDLAAQFVVKVEGEVRVQYWGERRDEGGKECHSWLKRSKWSTD